LVDQLTANDFELIIEGKPHEIAFFERVSLSRENNERTASNTATNETSSAVSAARVRTVLFYVDDLHLSATSLVQTREALLDFVKRGRQHLSPILFGSDCLGFYPQGGCQFTDPKSCDKVSCQR
jgi:hypothetical protein